MDLRNIKPYREQENRNPLGARITGKLTGFSQSRKVWKKKWI